ncbi:hypothetical protein C8245_22940 [Paracidovorax avenae]|uniref:RyR domain-containing protein n=1 Tax=Paracidovorax avenae TaxID=80867 RepID=UPI000D20C03E|nr:RyR domain-containing protein [Paracidovorax avenae]AVS68137.1 hypothetical protein C8245_22940 [Paracidovorax avenae]
MNNTDIARAAHEVNRAYCAAIGDFPPTPSWADADDSQRTSILAGVNMHLGNPGITPEQAHEAWMRSKAADGWTFGVEKDIVAKTHPCMVPYADLPERQRVKDYLFAAIVAVMKDMDAVPARQTPEVAPLSPREALQAKIAADLSLGVAVEFIGRKPWTDRIYGTGLSFVPGQSRTLPGEIARRFLRHGDLFTEPAAPEQVGAEATGAEQSAATQPPVDATDSVVDDTAEQLAAAATARAAQEAETNRVRNQIDTINQMDKDALVDFAQVNYGQKVAKNTSIETMRAKVASMVEQFGVV